MKKHISTFCIHPFAARDQDTSVTPPVYPSTTYPFIEGDTLPYPGYFSTYNQTRLAKFITELEGGEWGIVVNSGMAAIVASLMAFLKTGDHIILSSELYGGTTRIVKEELSRFGITYSLAGASVESFKEQIRKETKLILIETPSNPYLSILPLDEISALAKQHSIITVVDNTVATPINQQPLQLGFDISIESGTKYLGGHNDLQFGTIVCRDAAMSTDLLRVAKRLGGALSPETCYQAERSLKTLALRVQKHNENAMDVANALEKHELIEKVYYPGLESHYNHDVATRQMKGFSGLMSFEIADQSPDLNSFLKALTVVIPALSFGGLESVICLPSKTSHIGLADERMNRLVRLSVGLEDADDLIIDIDQALRKTIKH